MRERRRFIGRAFDSDVRHVFSYDRSAPIRDRARLRGILGLRCHDDVVRGSIEEARVELESTISFDDEADARSAPVVGQDETRALETRDGSSNEMNFRPGCGLQRLERAAPGTSSNQQCTTKDRTTR
jgi:hypothetical protein